MKKIITILCEVVMMLLLTACGAGSGSSSSREGSATLPAGVPAADYGQLASDLETEIDNNVPAANPEQPVSDSKLEIDNYVPATAPYDDSDDPDAVENSENKSEIIMVVDDCDTGNFSVYSVNSASGEKNIISSFTLYSRVTSNADGRKWINVISNIGCSTRAPLRGMFSKDYKYIAVTRYAEDTGEFHAGYYDEERRFYDATVAVDAVGGDFDEPVIQISIGFTEEGHFVFAELPESPNVSWIQSAYRTYNPDWKVYQVDLAENGGIIKSSMKPYDGLDRLQGDDWEWLEEGCEVTDWTDETHCILNYPDKIVQTWGGGIRIDRWGVRILDTQTQEYSSLISSETRTNWSGVISPDGKYAAFLSAPITGNGSASLYYVPIDGGEPVKICDDISVCRGSFNNTISRPVNFEYSSGSKNVVFLTEWINVQ